MKIALIIPTYKEAGAIGSVLAQLEEAFRTAPHHDWHIVVIDGNSPDGTADIVREAGRKNTSIHLIIEPEKRGIAAAYLTGMKHAVDVLKADAFAEFDGDGQHNPADIVRLAAALDEGHDYVIGSRYIPGGSVPAAWAFHRKILSRFGSLYSRILLELPVHDVTSGLKLTRIEGFAQRLPLASDKLLSSQYAYKIHLLFAMAQLGARIKEVPIHFLEREHDASKSTWRDIVESLKVTGILRIRNLRSWRLLRVVAIGGFGFVLQSIFFEIVGIRSELLRPSTAAVFGGELAILSNFFLNERFSFSDRIAAASGFLKRILRFHMVSSGSILVQWAVVFVAESMTESTWALRGAFVLGVGLGFILNYVGYYFYVWRTAVRR